MNDLKKRAEEIRDEKRRSHNTAERVGGLLADMAVRLDEIQKNSEEIMNEVFPLAFRTIDGGGMFEVGREVIPTISWTLKRNNEEVLPESATVNGAAEGVSPDFKSYTGEPITETNYYDISATYGTQSVDYRLWYSFGYKKYWGVSDKPVLGSSDIREMGSAFLMGKAMAKTAFDCTGGKYPYYIIPADGIYDDLEVWVDGIKTSDLVISQLEITNRYEAKKMYKVIRLNNLQTGVLNIEFK